MNDDDPAGTAGLVGWIPLERGGKRYGVLTDDVGTPWAVVDPTDAVVDALTWSAHGAVESESALTPSSCTSRAGDTRRP